MSLNQHYTQPLDGQLKVSVVYQSQRVNHFAASLLFCQELDGKIDTTLMSVH